MSAHVAQQLGTKAHLARSRSHLLHLISVPRQLAIELLHLDLKQPGLRGHSVSQLRRIYSVQHSHTWIPSIRLSVLAIASFRLGFGLLDAEAPNRRFMTTVGRGRRSSNRSRCRRSHSLFLINHGRKQTEHGIEVKQKHARLSFVPRHHPANASQSHVRAKGNLPRPTHAQFRCSLQCCAVHDALACFRYRIAPLHPRISGTTYSN